MKLLSNLFVLVSAVVLLSSFSLAVVDSELNSDVSDRSVDVVSTRDRALNDGVEHRRLVQEYVRPDVETLPFGTDHGARVRMLQLERSIHMNILKGEMILERLSLSFEDDALTNLSIILDSLIDLKKDVASYAFVGGEEDVRAFLFFRREASDLTKEFREAVRSILSDNDAAALRRELNERPDSSDVRASYSAQLNRYVRAHNEEVLRTVSREARIVDDSLIDRVRNQEINARDIRAEVLNNVRGERASDVSVETLRELRETAMRKQVNIREERARLELELRERQAKQLEERLAFARNRIEERVPDDMQKRIAERINSVNLTRERINNVNLATRERFNSNGIDEREINESRTYER